jgi:Protein of unknown function (DUF3025)
VTTASRPTSSNPRCDAWEPARFAQPRFTRIADLIERIVRERDWPSIEALNECFAVELASVGVRLVESAKTKSAIGADGAIDPSTLYEVRIIDRGEVPTRPRNAHDLLNAVVWAAFPRSKLALTRRLAAVQRARAAGRRRLPATRTREHDRLALIDEGGVLCVSGASMWIFGHAIYEHAYAGELGVRGAAIDLEVPTIDGLGACAAREAIDRCFAVVDPMTVVRGGPGIPIEAG